MKLKYLFSLLRTVRIPGLLPIMADWKGVVRFHFLYSAIDSGLLTALNTPCSREELIQKLNISKTEIFDALLNVGVSIKELQCKNGRYSIRGKRSKAMTGQYGDMLTALVQANVTYYNNSYRNAAARMNGAPLGDDLERVGDIVARFSKFTDPVMKHFVSEVVAGKETLKVLDIGCGSGSLLKTILDLNANATGLGVEKDDAVADQAARNILNWGLNDRFEIIKGDIRDLPSSHNAFDLITLVNVVYYFPFGDRIELFRSLRSKLSHGGSLVIVMNMEGKESDAAAANLNMVNASLEGVTPLPNPSKLKRQLTDSGFSTVEVTPIMPGSSFMGIHASS